MKKLIALLLALVMVLGLAACGAKEEAAETQAAIPTADAAASEAAAVTEGVEAVEGEEIIVKADDTRFDACKTAEDVEAVLAALDEGTKIGAQTGTTGALYIKGDEAFGFPGIANAEAVTYDSAALATQDLLNGRVDFVIVDADPAAAIVAKLNG